jgi:hypothetical protein
MGKGRFCWLHSLKLTHYRIWVRAWRDSTRWQHILFPVPEGICEPTVSDVVAVVALANYLDILGSKEWALSSTVHVS